MIQKTTPKIFDKNEIKTLLAPTQVQIKIKEKLINYITDKINEKKKT